MIKNEQELQVTQARIAKLQQWLANLRRTARPEEFDAVTSGYRREIERMQAAALDFLLRPLEHSAEPSPPAERVNV